MISASKREVQFKQQHHRLWCENVTLGHFTPSTLTQRECLSVSVSLPTLALLCFASPRLQPQTTPSPYSSCRVTILLLRNRCSPSRLWGFKPDLLPVQVSDTPETSVGLDYLAQVCSHRDTCACVHMDRIMKCNKAALKYVTKHNVHPAQLQRPRGACSTFH